MTGVAGIALLLLFIGRVVLDMVGKWPASPIARHRWCFVALSGTCLIVWQIIMQVMAACI